jgi:uncharacterized membrane protein
MNALRLVSILLQAAAFTFAGVMHFVKPAPFVAIVPDYLPGALMLVYVSGVAEIAGGVGLLVPALRTWAGWGLIALLLAVFPANIHMALHKIPWDGKPLPEWALWIRLPLQALLIAWVWWAAVRSSN